MQRMIARLSASGLLVLLAACAAGPHGASTQEQIDSVLAAAAEPAPAAPPKAVRDALLPRLDNNLSIVEEPRFDVDVDQAPARAFFRGLIEGTSRNLVVHPDVSGRISLRMRDVTVNEVLETVREVYGYDYRASGNGWVVMPATLQTRLFQIDYLHLERAGISRTRVSSGQVSETGGSDDRGAARLGRRQAHSQDGSSTQMAETTGTRIDTRYASDFWEELRLTLTAIVGNADGRGVVINAQTGLIIVRAMPEELRAVEQFLASAESTAQRQVILEAKIIEVQLNDNFQAGINWAAVADQADGDSSFYGLAAPTDPFQRDFDDLGGTPVTVSPGSQVTGFNTQTIGSGLTLAFDIGDFNAFVELLKVQGDTRVLSSPRVATLNNQKAVIKAGTDEFFVTDISSNTVTGTASATSRDVELTPFFSGIALDVTPQIAADRSVILHIHPTVSEVSDQQKDLTVGGETDRLPLAFSEIRESDTIVRARSGQIIAIGGLMRSTSRDESFGTPGLSRLPGVGALFRSKRTSERKTELVILLKPTVVSSDADWADAARDSLVRVRGFSQH